MTINTAQLRSMIGPVWQEISSLWSGVDFSFSDSLPDLDPADLPAGPRFLSESGDGPHSGSSHCHPEPC